MEAHAVTYRGYGSGSPSGIPISLVQAVTGRSRHKPGCAQASDTE